MALKKEKTFKRPRSSSNSLHRGCDEKTVRQQILVDFLHCSVVAAVDVDAADVALVFIINNFS